MLEVRSGSVDAPESKIRPRFFGFSFYKVGKLLFGVGKLSLPEAGFSQRNMRGVERGRQFNGFGCSGIRLARVFLPEINVNQTHIGHYGLGFSLKQSVVFLRSFCKFPRSIELLGLCQRRLVSGLRD